MSDSAFRPGSDEEWGDLMRQLQARPQARPRPYFYARVQARLATNAAAESSLLPIWLRRPAYAALLGALLMTLSGDGSALRPAPEITHCAACPGDQHAEERKH